MVVVVVEHWELKSGALGSIDCQLLTFLCYIGVHSRGLGGRNIHKIYDVLHHHSE